jgi:hypothetical protein
MLGMDFTINIVYIQNIDLAGFESEVKIMGYCRMMRCSDLRYAVAKTEISDPPRPPEP